MAVDLLAYQQLKSALDAKGVTLIAVSKTKPVEDLQVLYDAGHRDFGENYVQELLQKQTVLPKDIRWHFIGHLQSNKVKMIAPFVHMIHGVDSIKLLEVIDKEGRKVDRKINSLLQVHIASEETKFGLDLQEAQEAASSYFLENKFNHVELCGLMGMASFSDDQQLVESEFQSLKQLFNEIKSAHKNAAHFNILSMGMSGDYMLAINNGSTMVRIGSMLFGSRNK
jgi:pyridoxal phosphate enzyme (YggS family)